MPLSPERNGVRPGIAAFASAKQRLPECRFVIVEHADATECVGFDDAASPARGPGDIGNLDD